jgi:hypothetical protein
MADAGQPGTHQTGDYLLGGIIALSPDDLNDVFFFYEPNREFVNGKSDKLPGRATVKRIVTNTLLLIVLISIPVALLFTGIISLIRPESLGDNFRFSMVISVLAAVWMGFSGYRQSQRLEREGKLVKGILTDFSRRMVFSRRGYGMGTSAHYAFETNQGLQVSGRKIVSFTKSRLSDGRELPPVGTPGVVVYLDKTWHTLL